MKAAFLASAVLAVASVAFYSGTAVYAAKASGHEPSAPKVLASRSLPKSFSLPMFFEPNQGQTDPQVKFLARGSGYGLFLTANEAVLRLQHSGPSSQLASSPVIRMKLDGANASARVSGASPLPGKSNYFIGNDPSKWRSGIPQFARVEYKSVYPGVDLVYYGNQGQLEYDFRVAPAADPNQIALSFQGASAHIVPEGSGDSGDLVLSTANGDVRFHAPRIYQPATPQSGSAEKTVTGNFRQLASNKIGFAIGDYDHSRELVIDPVLVYSTYLGGGGEGLTGVVQVAVDSAQNIYVAGSTDSANFPFSTVNTSNPPYQPCLGEPGVAANSCTSSTATNIFIAVINPSLTPNAAQLIWATYLGGSGTDNLAGLAVDTTCNVPAFNTCDIYVSGTTTSPNFPTSQPPTGLIPFQSAPTLPGTHGFLSKIGLNPSNLNEYGLLYSTYLAGNGVDHVTGLAIDANQNAYVTGDTTSTNPASAGFPATTNGYQTSSNSSGNPQFFASKINTNYSSTASMIYSTYFGGGVFPVGAVLAANQGGGIAVDPAPNPTPNIYITGTTNMLPRANGVAGFPLYGAQQSCLNEAGNTGTCNPLDHSTDTDAFVAKINPNISNSNPVYSTYLGGSGNDSGIAIAVDTSGNAYVTGSTTSSDWNVCNSFGPTCEYNGVGGATNAFIAKIGNLNSTTSTYPLTYFTYLGGTGPDVGNAIQVDSVGTVHVAGNTGNSDIPAGVITNPLPPENPTDNGQNSGTGGDAFVALISTSGVIPGDYLTYLGGGGLDQGTGIALDNYGNTYVAGTTRSSDFPITATTAFQPQLNGAQNAFVSQIGSLSALTVTPASGSPSPSPVPLGEQVAFTFNIANTGPDIAYGVNFVATVQNPAGLSNVQAKVNSGTGSCSAWQQGQQGPQYSTIACYIPTLTVCSPLPCSTPATVEVDVTASATATQPLTSINVAGAASAYNNPTPVLSNPPQPLSIHRGFRGSSQGPERYN